MYKKKALTPGSIVRGGRYEITINSLLAADSQGFLYRATGRQVTQQGKVRMVEVVMREHFMAFCSERGEDGSVITPDDIAPTVDGCLANFREASDLRADIASKHPSIINVLDQFTANNTYYYIVEYLSGPTLEEYVTENGPLTIEQAQVMLGPIFRGAAQFHLHHALHTDIHPGHIRFTTHAGVSKPVLFSLYNTIHFNDDGQRLWSMQNTNCREGYAPPEQYVEIEHFIPSTDLFALASTLVFAITGRHLPDSRTIDEDIIRNTLPPTLPETYAAAIIHALNPDYAERTLSISGFFDELQFTYDVDQRAPRPTEETETDETTEGVLKPEGRRMKLMALLSLLVAIGTIIVLFAMSR